MRLVLALTLLVVMHAVPVGLTSDGAIDAKPPVPRERRIAVGKTALYAREIGQGSPIVVLHGGPGLDMNYLVDDLAPLAASHRLIFYDQRGGGRSTLSTGVTAEQLVADLDALRGKVGLQRMTLLGHSWGAGLAALYAAAHPDRVERMILADAIPLRLSGLSGYGADLRSRLTPEETAKVDEALEARQRAKTPAEHVAACKAYWGVFARAYYSDPEAASRSKGDLCAVPGQAIANGRAVNESVMGKLGNYDWREMAAAFHMPVVVIHGAEDPIRLENAREWADTIPQARLVVIEHAGHMSYVERPEQFFGAIAEFLNGAATQ